MSQIAENKQNTKLTICGYGQNDLMGNFLLEGICDVVHYLDYVEKDGIKNDGR